MWAAEGCGRLRNDSGLAQRKSEKTKRQLEERTYMWRERQSKKGSKRQTEKAQMARQTVSESCVELAE